MPFPFTELCTLLSRLEEVEIHHPPLLPKERPQRRRDVVERWFKSHLRQLNELNVEGATALLSALLPGWRNERVYGIQAPSLCRILGRVLRLNVSELQIYQKPGNGDLAECLMRVLERRGPAAIPPVTIEEVDDMLQTLAGNCHWSDPSVPRLPPGSSEMRDQTIERILLRLSPNEGKWLARLILKNLRPIQVEDSLLLKNFHFLLPDLLRFQQNFHAAVSMLKSELRELPGRPDPRTEQGYRTAAAEKLRPMVGTKISRPHSHKARSIDYCLKMLGGREWVVERKYDGEYCEIHVDLSKSPDPAKCIKIFSKSGKDSTCDRKGIIETLTQSLRLGRKDCKIKGQAVLLGELVVFSDQEDRIMPFDEIRKHVARSGRFLGTDQDSLPKPHEHLAIVYFDVLLWDDEIIMRRSVHERRMWLREIYKKIHGRAIGAEWKVIDFSSDQARRYLGEQFSAANARRCEGLVLKPCGVPYFSLDMQPADYRCSYIKLKKDYTAGLGDEEDMAVIGASFDAQLAHTAPAKGYIKWTTFHLGCLTNKAEVEQRQARPVFKHIGSIDHEKCIPKAILETANILGNLSAQPYSTKHIPRVFDVEAAPGTKMQVVFDQPLVFEMLGSGYEKPSNCNFFMLRHPRVKKLHEDRTWLDCVSFQQLQNNARAAREVPPHSESQETRMWLDKLEQGCKRKFEKERLASPSLRISATPDRSTLLSSPVTRSRPTSIVPSPALLRPTPRPESRKAPSTPSALPSSIAPSKRRHEDREPDAIDANAKRQCVHVGTDRQRKDALANRTASSPLSEITNIANATIDPDGPLPNRRSRALSDMAKKLVSLVRPVNISESQEQSQLRRDTSRGHCEVSKRCPFSGTVIYLAPDIANYLYVSETLLECHDTVIVPSLSNWDRDSFSQPASGQIVSESQSYVGLRKIVLVESRRRHQVREVLRQIKDLNAGCFKERIEVYDWRILEDCENHDKGVEVLKKMHFIGATLFDDTRKRAIFVSERAELRV
ncbi:DNA ligase 4 [Pseudocercospora fuligena]|uniref:DNA ligase 4 n=1 Tax=Pseudocercospora fuligena TaxID=685502 RepID=A0A8H6RJE8_9PEZI|nr:DNA ligase 4 [Pseudocercospora fuligena]